MEYLNVLILLSFAMSSSMGFLQIGLQQRRSGHIDSLRAMQAKYVRPVVPHLVFPGGGIFFYWQAGAVTYLREQGYDLDSATMAGASAGALTATLLATGVDFYTATDLALGLADEAGVWDRKEGLQGIWGELISTWLDELLPHDATDMVGSDRLSLLITLLPAFQKQSISQFRDRNDLIECNMASIHLPWFLDSKITSPFRGKKCIDGSFLSKDQDYCCVRLLDKQEPIVFDWAQDPKYRSLSFFKFVDAVDANRIREMLEDGKIHAAKMEKRGAFDSLEKNC